MSFLGRSTKDKNLYQSTYVFFPVLHGRRGIGAIADTFLAGRLGCGGTSTLPGDWATAKAIPHQTIGTRQHILLPGDETVVELIDSGTRAESVLHSALGSGQTFLNQEIRGGNFSLRAVVPRRN